MGAVDVLIVGAGLAGARCAETLRALGFDGTILVAGGEPHPPYERPALSKEFLAGSRTAGSLAQRPDGFWEGEAIAFARGNTGTIVRHRNGYGILALLTDDLDPISGHRVFLDVIEQVPDDLLEGVAVE